MKPTLILTLLLCALAPLTQAKKINMDVYIQSESAGVGKARLAIIDKLLDKTRLEQKQAVAKDVEASYQAKIEKLVQSLSNPLFKPMVSVHVDINFLSTSFEQDVASSKRVGVVVVLKRNAVSQWLAQFDSENSAKRAMAEVISSSFSLPLSKINIILMG